ncbi:hypothetical protein ES705_33187 [subsurface metagenome]
MQLKWKVFRKSFPAICTKCGSLSSMTREYCEVCGAKDTSRETTKEDWEKSQTEEEVLE